MRGLSERAQHLAAASAEFKSGLAFTNVSGLQRAERLTICRRIYVESHSIYVQLHSSAQLPTLQVSAAYAPI